MIESKYMGNMDTNQLVSVLSRASNPSDLTIILKRQLFNKAMHNIPKPMILIESETTVLIPTASVR